MAKRPGNSGEMERGTVDACSVKKSRTGTRWSGVSKTFVSFSFD